MRTATPDIIAYNDTIKNLSMSWGLPDGSFGGMDDEDKFTQQLFDNRTIIGDLIIRDFDENGYPDIAFADQGSHKDGFATGSVQLIMNPGM